MSFEILPRQILRSPLCHERTSPSLMEAAKLHIGLFMGSLTEDSVLQKRPGLKSWIPVIH